MRAPFVLTVLSGLAFAMPADAQKTEDEARLVFTMGISYTGGTDLWSVQDQPVLVLPTGFDLISLDRNISGGIGVIFSGMYFPKPALGFVGEVFFMGIGLEDQCAIASSTPTARTEQLCSSIDGATNSSSTVMLSLGPILRAGADQPISPYVRAQVGLLFNNLSPIAMSGTILVADSTGGGEYLQSVVYTAPSSSQVTVGFVFGGGATAVIGKGWQLRAEVRDNLAQFATVTGPTAPGDDTPVVVNEWKNLWSIVLGADIVLEKKRGHRY